MIKQYLIFEKKLFCRHIIIEMGLDELFSIVNSDLFDLHFIVFEEDKDSKRFPLKKPVNIEDFYLTCEKSLNMELYSINSDDYNILSATYIDSYYRRPLLNE